ncbi:MAG: DUF4173 domain-containing protein [Chitinophagaceae bacterium]
MKKNIIYLTLITAGAVLFNLVFWQEKLGINTVLFDAFLLFALSLLYPQARQNTTVRWLLVGHLICLAMVIVHNTMLSKIAFITTLLLLTAFTEYVHKSAWFAGGSVLLNVIFCAASFTEQLQYLKPVKMRKGSVGKLIRFAILPMLLLFIFFVIYLAANSIFQEIASKMGWYLEQFFIKLSSIFAWQRILFLLLGLYLTATILLKSRVNYFSNKDVTHTDELQRVRMKRRLRPFYQLSKIIMGKLTDGMMALKNENTIGFISLVLLNLLLAVINTIDISYLWFNASYRINEPAYKMVHQGAELLILSIILAMAVLLFFFKGNLNFYKRNKWLKYGAAAWIIQNLLLVVSVFIRDYYYISRSGLAYKRIGVLFFLLMVLAGLITMFVKIWQQKTTYFLLRVNAWTGVTVLVLASAIHWDELIAGYNLRHKDTIELDVPFLLSLSDKALPLLDKNIDALQQRQDTVQRDKPIQPGTEGACTTCYVDQLRKRESHFIEKQQQLSWLSWNYADERTRQYLSKKPISVIH